MEQCIYSFAVRKAETNGVRDFCRSHGVGMLGFSPLCQGILSGKYRNGIPKDSRVAKSAQLGYDKTMNFYQQNKERIDRYMEVCDAYNLRPVDVAINWTVQKEMYPVLGASKPQQLEDTLKGLEVEIPEKVWEELETI